jgi:hypothetical protein
MYVSRSCPIYVRHWHVPDDQSYAAGRKYA